jgi:hypothetical protein
MKKITFGFSIALALLLASCAEPAADKANDKEDALKKEAAKPLKEKREKAYYPIPSPEQMFSFINDNGVGYSKKLMNNAANVSSYSDPISMALNFGVYTADLAYAAAYQDVETTIDLYKIVKKLGADLDIEELMTKDGMEEMLANMENPDSLAIVAGRSYYQAVDFLEGNDQQGKLALMSVGGWIESVFITINSVEKFEENSLTANRIADQKITFGNLYTYLKRHQDKVGVLETINKLKDIRTVYASLQEEKYPSNLKKTGGKLILGGGRKILISEIQFNELKEAVNTCRTNIVD